MKVSESIVNVMWSRLSRLLLGGFSPSEQEAEPSGRESPELEGDSDGPEALPEE